MKIAIFTESYIPVINGVTRSIDLLWKGLKEEGHQVVVYAPRTRDFVDNDPGVRRFPSYYFPGAPADYPLAFPYSASMYRQFASEQFDLVHLQTPFALGLAGLLLAKRHRLPIVATLHTLYEEYAHYLYFLPEPLTRSLIRWLLRRFYNQADAVVAPSPSVARLLREYGIRRPVHVIPTGITPPVVTDRAVARKAFDIPPDAPLLLYTGRLAPEKNIWLMMQAFASIVGQMPDARLLVIGSGPGRQDAERNAEGLGISESVTFAGFRPHEDVEVACRAADLFLFPSSTETQAVSVVEAMCCGVPPVVVAAFGPADIVEDGVSGRVVPAEPAEMAAAALDLLENHERRRRLGQGAVRRAADYTSVSTTRKVLDLYQSVAEKPSGTAAASQPT